jgi:hypothetical protein
MLRINDRVLAAGLRDSDFALTPAWPVAHATIKLSDLDV